MECSTTKCHWNALCSNRSINWGRRTRSIFYRSSAPSHISRWRRMSDFSRIMIFSKRLMLERLLSTRMYIMLPILLLFIPGMAWGFSDPNIVLPGGHQPDTAMEVLFLFLIHIRRCRWLTLCTSRRARSLLKIYTTSQTTLSAESSCTQGEN